MPYWDEVENEEPSGEFQPLSTFLPNMLNNMVVANTLASDCESEIEIDLGTQLTAAFKVIEDETLSLVPQYVLGRFRYDFAITRKGRPKPIALIECDGKEFKPRCNLPTTNPKIISPRKRAYSSSVFLVLRYSAIRTNAFVEY